MTPKSGLAGNSRVPGSSAETPRICEETKAGLETMARETRDLVKAPFQTRELMYTREGLALETRLETTLNKVRRSRLP